MRVYNDLHQLPVFKKPIITIGTFDGVHRGHVSILTRLIKKAREVGGESILITFDPHPRMVLENQNPGINILTTLNEKIRALSDLEVDILVVVPFTPAFADLSSIDYIDQFIMRYFRPHTFIIGYDHHFGRGREGNYQLLDSVKDKYGFQLEEIPVQEIEDIAISSTQIRKALQQGDIDKANEYLGRPYALRGKVIHGAQQGRVFGFPTANIEVEDKAKLIPANGVYGVQIIAGGDTFRGMMNIGYRPTVTSEGERSIEVHIFNFDQDLYDEMICVEIIVRLRDEQKFAGLDALKAQLEIDKENTIQLLEKLLP